MSDGPSVCSSHSVSEFGPGRVSSQSSKDTHGTVQRWPARNGAQNASSTPSAPHCAWPVALGPLQVFALKSVCPWHVVVRGLQTVAATPSIDVHSSSVPMYGRTLPQLPLGALAPSAS